MRNKNILRTLAVVALFFYSLTIFAQKEQTKYQPDQYYGREYRLDGDTLRYRILYPAGYDAGIEFPLFIFLHGEDERGWDNLLQLKYAGKIYKEQTVRDYYPAVVLIPQCAYEDAWANYNILDDGEIETPDNPEETHACQMLTKLIELYTKKPFVDSKRVYIVGMSMGAFGALDMVARHQDLFTAAVSIGGAIFPDRLKKVKKFPVRFFHGADDKIVPISVVRDDYYQLKSNGCDADLVEYKDTGHDAWTIALAASDFMEWIFDKKKK